MPWRPSCGLVVEGAMTRAGDVIVRRQPGTTLAEWGAVTAAGLGPTVWHAGSVTEVLDAANAFTEASGGTVVIAWGETDAPDD